MISATVSQHLQPELQRCYPYNALVEYYHDSECNPLLWSTICISLHSDCKLFGLVEMHQTKRLPGTTVPHQCRAILMPMCWEWLTCAFSRLHFALSRMAHVQYKVITAHEKDSSIAPKLSSTSSFILSFQLRELALRKQFLLQYFPAKASPLEPTIDKQPSWTRP